MGSNPQIVEAFREAARQGESIVARREGDGWEVRAVGRTGDGRRVAWVRPQGAEGPGTAGLFIEGLRESYGEPIGREVSRQLGLREDSEQALEAREVLGALEMASTSQEAFAGLNFLSRQAISARTATATSTGSSRTALRRPRAGPPCPASPASSPATRSGT